jgi:AcrR family transcriptional regulator
VATVGDDDRRAPDAAAPGPNGRAQRARILAAATELIAAHGVRGMTMRQLAAACDLHIATLYHYFASKSDLVGAIVDDRHYDAGLRDLVLPVDRHLPPRPRLETFFTSVAGEALGELRLWRMLVGESLRDDAVALAEVRRLAGALERAVDRWLADLFPELRADGRPARAAVTTVVTGQLLALFLEEMLLGDDGRGERLAGRAAATAAVAFPDAPPGPARTGPD